MAQLQLVQELPGHSEAAWQVAFNPARSLLASCSTDKTVRMYSYSLPSDPSSSSSSSQPSALPTSDSSKASFSLASSIGTEHKRTIRSVAWSPDGRTLATGSFDSSVGIWEEIDPDDPAEDPSEGVYRANHTPRSDDDDDDMDGGRAGGQQAGSSAKEWECVTTLEGHESECKSVGFSSDGALLASCSRDKSVWVWEVQPDSDFECIAVMMEHTQDVKCIAWHPKEEILASASYDSHIHLMFDDPDGDWCNFQKLHPKLQAQSLHISNPSPSLKAAMSPTEEDAAVESLDIPQLEEDETVWCLAWSPCGRYLASGGDRGGIRIWRRNGHHLDSLFTEVIHTAAHSRSVFALSWTSDPRATAEDSDNIGLLASGAGDGKIIVWQFNTESGINGDTPNGDTQNKSASLNIMPIAAVREAHGVNDVNGLSWCKREDGKGAGMLASCGDDGGVKVWRLVSE